MNPSQASGSAKETAFVTGAASGIGLAEDGFRVALLDQNPDAIWKAAASLQGEGWDAIAHAADIQDRPAIAASLSAEARIDVMVCAAGIAPMHSFLGITKEDLHTAVNVSPLGTFICCEEATRRIKSNERLTARKKEARRTCILRAS
ncbi:SDR family NAD(P)-dependent oxidoreductase [Comamonas sp. F1-6]|uniref:SDR family NAD(P)-dependent oxidoreductase n=1 Tax=Comamonas sp. F1-6 TaxID=673550 RepID=UPI0031D2F60E